MEFLYRWLLDHLEFLCGAGQIPHQRRALTSRKAGQANSAENFAFDGKERSVLDLAMLVIGLGFFALAIGYAYACERL